LISFYLSNSHFSSTRPTPATTPVKTPFQVNLTETVTVDIHQERVPSPPADLVAKLSDTLKAAKEVSVVDSKPQAQSYGTSTDESKPQLEQASDPPKSETVNQADISTLAIESREVSPGFERSKSRKLKKNQKKSIPKLDTTDSGMNAAGSAAGAITPTSTDTSDYKSANTSFSHQSSRNTSFTSTKSDNSLSAMDKLIQEKDDTSTSLFKQNRVVTPTDTARHSKSCSSSSSSSIETPKPRKSQKQRRLSYSKDQSLTLELINNSHTKTKLKSTKLDGEKLGAGNLKSGTDTIDSETHKKVEALMSSLEDPEQWPALGSAKASLSNIADGKPPAIPTLQPMNERIAAVVQKNSNVIIPAVPLNMIPRRRNS
jgi:hypothetical protein